MYKVFFVNDETSIRREIMEEIGRDNSEFTLYGEAPDVKMAITLIEDLMPDILIADVKIPFIDGLELAKHIKTIMPWIKTIILSGHDEFNYTKQAISIGTSEYLLKPTTSKELMNVLAKITEKVKIEHNEIKKLEDLKEIANIIKTYHTNEFLRELSHGNINIEEALKKSAELGISIQSNKYIIISILIHRKNPEDYNIYLTAKSWITNILSKYENILSFTEGSEKVICIIKGHDKPELEEAAFGIATTLKHETEKNLSCYISISIGSCVDNIKNLPSSLHDTEKVERYAGLINQNQITSIKNIIENTNMPLSFAEIEKLPILEKLRYGSKSDINKYINSYFDNIDENSVVSFLYMNYSFMDVLMSVSRFIEEIDGNVFDILGKYANINNIITRPLTARELKEILTDILGYAFDFRDSKIRSPYSGIISKAKTYIQQNFAEQNISLHTVAKYVNVSPNYFSMIFKQETGENFINYITHIRLEKAKLLLKTTSLRTSDIGYSIGYNDTHYFSYVFKKNIGMTPKEYRK